LAFTETELLHLLHSECPDDEQRLNNWLESTHPEAASEQLARALQTARSNRCTNGVFRVGVGALFATVAFSLVRSWNSHPSTPTVLEVMVPWLMPLFFAASVSDKAEVKAGILLARLQDERAVEPLARVWQPSRTPAPLVSDLHHLLATLHTHGEIARPRVASALRLVVRRACTPTLLPHPLRPAPDLSDMEADLALTAVRYLAGTGNQSDTALLQTIATARRPDTHQAPNRALVREAAGLVVRS
jgi:hypothetical protein